MDISPAKNSSNAKYERHEALAAGHFGETCAISRQHGSVPDPDVFARRYIDNELGAHERCSFSAAEDLGKGADPLSRVA